MQNGIAALSPDKPCEHSMPEFADASSAACVTQVRDGIGLCLDNPSSRASSFAASCASTAQDCRIPKQGARIVVLVLLLLLLYCDAG